MQPTGTADQASDSPTLPMEEGGTRKPAFGPGGRLARDAQPARRTNATVIYESLYRSIARMELRPGEPLLEKELTQRFGVSRTPVREALLLLEGNGLVDLLPQAGTFVARIPIAAIHEAIIIRKALEELAVARAAQVADRGGVARLDVTLARQRLAAELVDTSGFHEADEAFHETIALLAGLTTLWPMVRKMKVHLDRLRVLSLPLEGRMDETIAEHQRIRDAIASNDVDAAKAVLHDHLGVMVPYVDQLSRRYPDYFSGSLDGIHQPPPTGV
jgi:DNA-binding GntR family transcriptional regulator